MSFWRQCAIWNVREKKTTIKPVMHDLEVTSNLLLLRMLVFASKYYYFISRANHINPLSGRAFFGQFIFKYRKFDFVTQFLRNGSTKIQSLVYHFVENLKLFYENVKIFSQFWLCLELQLSEVTMVSCRIYSTLALKGLIRNTFIRNLKLKITNS